MFGDEYDDEFECCNYDGLYGCFLYEQLECCVVEYDWCVEWQYCGDCCDEFEQCCMWYVCECICDVEQCVFVEFDDDEFCYCVVYGCDYLFDQFCVVVFECVLCVLQ